MAETAFKIKFGGKGLLIPPSRALPLPLPLDGHIHVKLFSLKFLCLFVCFGGRGEGTYTLSGWAHSCEVVFFEVCLFVCFGGRGEGTYRPYAFMFYTSVKFQ